MPAIGQYAADFELLNQDGKPVKLSNFRGKKVIIFAFPKANTMGCNNQACGFRDVMPQIHDANAVVLGLSADSVQTLKNWHTSKDLGFDLLSDPDHRVLEEWGAWGIPVLGLISLPVINRSYWVVDENGWVEDMKIGISPGESVRKALFTIEETPVLA